MSIPGVSFNQTQDTQSWVEFGRDLAVYTVAFCLPTAAVYTYKAVNAATQGAIFNLRWYYNSWNTWYKYKDERESIGRAIHALQNGDNLEAASRVLYIRIESLSKNDMRGATDLLQRLRCKNPGFVARGSISREIRGLDNLTGHDFITAKVRIENDINDLIKRGDIRGAFELNRQLEVQLEAYLQRPEVKSSNSTQEFIYALQILARFIPENIDASSDLVNELEKAKIAVAVLIDLESRYNSFPEEQRQTLDKEYNLLQAAKRNLKQKIQDIESTRTRQIWEQVWAIPDDVIWAQIAAERKD
ncbi:MAG TPA: hypothetical protein VLG44_06990 [Chlamydiales bacterium]|nr:hypothetical protein [Chlamydiales bacterium]